jgi:hypothetical protein
VRPERHGRCLWSIIRWVRFTATEHAVYMRDITMKRRWSEIDE